MASELPHVDIAIVGSGPGGFSAAARAAARGMSHVVLERQGHLADTLQSFQAGKPVMATPERLPLRSDFLFEAGRKEIVLESWRWQADKLGVHIRFNAEVRAIAPREGGGFHIALEGGDELLADKVVLAIGLQGNQRKLTIPGAHLPHIQYRLDDPQSFQDQDILVIGGGDSAIETALALIPHNRVTLCYRGSEFARAKTGNLQALEQAAVQGLLYVMLDSNPKEIAPGTVHIETAKGNAVLPCSAIIARLGAIPPRRFLESIGIRFHGADATALPELSPTLESNVPGLYIVGALAGYPLIKQALNQGYEVVEAIAGNPLPPTDEPLLLEKLTAGHVESTVDAFIDKTRRMIPLFAGLTHLQMRELLAKSIVHTLKPGEPAFHAGDYSNTFWSIVSGSMAVLIDPNDPGRRVFLNAGDFFGEMGLISGRRRNATVVAQTTSVLIETSRRSMLKLITSSEAVQRALDRAFIVRQIHRMFGVSLGDDRFAPLLDKMRIEHYRPGQTIYAEGDDGDCMHLIRRGSVTVERRVGGKNIVQAYLQAGSYMGEIALLGKVPRTATVRAAVATETVRIDSEHFHQLGELFPDLKRQVYKTYRERLAADSKNNTDNASDAIRFLIAQGIGEGTDILTIDASLCVRCGNCETACARMHGGVSRLKRDSGSTVGNLHLPISCRHCEHPHCMAECPPDAIHREKGGEVWIDAAQCIGCGQCESNCPHGVIRIIEEAPAPPEGFLPKIRGWSKNSRRLWHRLLFLQKQDDLHPESGLGMVGEKNKLAVKCDMCRNIAGGPSCVRFCPTGAALRTRPEALLDRLRRPR